jgi:hypothetical protein
VKAGPRGRRDQKGMAFHRVRPEARGKYEGRGIADHSGRPDRTGQSGVHGLKPLAMDQSPLGRKELIGNLAGWDSMG